MKKYIIAMVAALAITGCNAKWEYTTFSVESETTSRFRAPEFSLDDSDLNRYGEEGWELVDVYTITETVHPNFGDDKYVTGIRENTRTTTINYVFKRRKTNSK